MYFCRANIRRGCTWHCIPRELSKGRGNKISQMALQSRTFSIVIAVLLHWNPLILVVLSTMCTFLQEVLIFYCLHFCVNVDKHKNYRRFVCDRQHRQIMYLLQGTFNIPTTPPTYIIRICKIPWALLKRYWPRLRLRQTGFT